MRNHGAEKLPHEQLANCQYSLMVQTSLLNVKLNYIEIHGERYWKTPPPNYQIWFNKTVSKNFFKYGNQAFVFNMLQSIDSDKFSVLKLRLP